MSISANYPLTRPSLNLDFANSKVLDPRITFSRASTATYYDGKTTVKAEENLLQYSQDFSNAVWTKTAATVTANSATAPDGTTTADSLIESSATSEHYAAGTAVAFTSGLNYTLSCFVKPNGRTWFRLSFSSSAFPTLERFAYFDVQNGVLGTVAPNTTATITSVGNGWYRCAISRAATASVTAPAFAVICDADNNTTYTGDGTSGIYLWGAQLEQRSTVTAYTPTTTSPITNYIPALQTAAANVARFDHDPVTGESKGLLIEEQRTNLLTYSEQFDNAAWNKSRSNITANSTIAPDGTLTADKFFEDTTASNSHYVYQGANLTSGMAYSYSVFVKPAERKKCAIQFYNTNGAFTSGAAYFDLSTGTVSGKDAVLTSAAITPVGNGWFRITATATANATASGNIAIHLSDASRLTNYTGDGTSGLYIWGAQLEAGAFPTSYIPTTSAQVTRAADLVSMTGSNFSSWYRQDEGTFVWSGDVNDVATTPAVISASDGSDATNLLQINTSGSGVIRMRAVASSATQVASVSSGVTASPRVQFNAAFGVQPSNYAISVNGSTPVTQLSGMVPTVNQLRFLQTGSGGSVYSGHIKRIAYFPRRLSNTELQALTS